MKEIKCSYCNGVKTEKFYVLQWEDMSPKKREVYFAAKGRLPVCVRCRVDVQNGETPMERSLLVLLHEKLHNTSSMKHKIAPPHDVSALRILAHETMKDIDALILCEKEFQQRVDEIPSLPDKLQNVRKNTCIGQIGKLNKIGNHIREINAYISQHIVIDYAEARRVANNAMRPEWVRLNVMLSGLGKCRYCETTENLTIDHVFPVFRGGGSTQGNLQLLCRKCNSTKGMIDRNIGT